MAEFQMTVDIRRLQIALDARDARIKELEDRLELTASTLDGKKTIKLEIGDCDGIGCRDETIKLLKERIKGLECEK